MQQQNPEDYENDLPSGTAFLFLIGINCFERPDLNQK